MAHRAPQPDSPHVADSLGWVYYRRGVPLICSANVPTSRCEGTEERTERYHLGLAYRKVEDVLKARESFTEVVALSPESAQGHEARMLLGEM